MKLLITLFCTIVLFHCNGLSQKVPLKGDLFYKPINDDVKKMFPSSVKFIEDMKTQFKKFKSEYKRVYADIYEEAKRFKHFIENYWYIHKHNIDYNNGKVHYALGLNEFSDLNSTELKKMHSCYKKPKSGLHVRGSKYLRAASKQSLPRTIDWRKKGAVTGVKNQGQCGSCWSFSTTGSVEGQHFRKTGELVSLSEQQLVDCSGAFGEMGCEGGLMDNAYDYIKRVGGLDSEESYPYVSGRIHHKQSYCHFKRSNVAATVTGHMDVAGGDEEALREAVANVGPISVGIDASSPMFMHYQRGVYTDYMCSPNNLDHGVLVVGYGVEDGQDYWLVKNSWGPTWGLNGYIKMRRNFNNMCGIATNASYPLV